MTDSALPRTARRFHMSWLRLYAAMGMSVTLLTLPFLLLVSWLDDGIVGLSFMAGFCLLVGLLLEALIALAIAGLNPVSVVPDGIVSFNFFGQKQMLRWDAMQGLSRKWLFMTPWFLIENPASTVWLPLWLNDSAEFWKSVDALAPADNVLRQRLGGRQKAAIR